MYAINKSSINALYYMWFDIEGIRVPHLGEMTYFASMNLASE